MDRKFKVGDIVNARSDGFELTEKPVNEILGNYVRVCTYLFTPDELTLVTSVETNRGVEQYKDQFAPWKPGHLVTIGAEAINKLSDLEIDAMSISNCAIRIMIKEQQT